jgi:hypothetical protein
MPCRNRGAETASTMNIPYRLFRENVGSGIVGPGAEQAGLYEVGWSQRTSAIV